MRIFLTLLKVHLNLNFGISALKYLFKKEKKRRWVPILIVFAIVVGIGPLVALYTLIAEGIFLAGLSMSQPEIVITISFMLGQVIVLIFGLFYVMGAFYFSNDISILIPLPLKPYQVLGSKFIVVMVNEYLTLLPVLIPPVFIYGFGMGMGLSYWIKAFLLIIASPVIPLIIDSLFIMIMMRFVNIRRSKDFLAIAGGLFGMLITIGINFLFQRVPKENSSEFIKSILEDRYGLIELIGRKFPPSLWATFGLSQSGAQGFGYFIMFIGLSIFMFIALLWIGNLIFYKGLLSGQEVSRKRKTLSAEAINRRYERMSNPVAAIFKREWKLLLRTPVYMLNGLAGTIMGPLIAAMIFAAQGQTGEMKELFAFLNMPEYTTIVTLAGLGFMLFTAGMNVAASTALSREGKAFWIAKIIPVPAWRQVLGKLLQGFSISLIGSVITGIILVVFLKFSLLRVIIIFIIAVFGSVLLTSLNLIIDVFHPKLVWNSPQEAMKQNMNSLFGMLASFAIIGILVAISIALLMLKLPEWAIFLILLLAIIILSVPALIGLFTLAERQYRKLEV